MIYDVQSPTIPTLISALDDEIFTVRSAALNSLKSFNQPITANLLMDYVNSSKANYPEIGLKAIANYLYATADSTGSIYAKKKYKIMLELENLAESENELIRAEALSALWQNGGELQKRWVNKKIENEFSPFVRAVFEETRGKSE